MACFCNGVAVRDAAALSAVQRREQGLSILVHILDQTPAFPNAAGREAWADVVIATTEMQRHSPTRHLVSDIDIDFTSEDTAVVTSFAIIRHFIVSSAVAADEPTPHRTDTKPRPRAIRRRGCPTR